MGNYRFRLSSMMPNARFYKLKDMRGGNRGHGILNSNKQSSHHSRITAPVPPPRHTYISNRASCYFTSREQPEKLPNSPIHPKASNTHFPADPPRKSKRRARRIPDRHSTKLVSSVSSSCTALGSVCKPGSIPDNLLHQHVENDDLCKTVTINQVEFSSLETWSRSFNCSVDSSATNIIIDVDRRSSLKQTLDAAAIELDLPPILAKLVKRVGSYNLSNSNSTSEQESPPRRVSHGIHRIKISGSSPKTASKRIEPNRRSKATSRSKVAIQKRKGLQESFAFVKSSSNPERDFRDSMMEMIVENNLHASKDLEELLACYLTLNSNEYHDVIVSVFKQIWFELIGIRF